MITATECARAKMDAWPELAGPDNTYSPNLAEHHAALNAVIATLPALTATDAVAHLGALYHALEALQKVETQGQREAIEHSVDIHIDKVHRFLISMDPTAKNLPVLDDLPPDEWEQG